MTDCLLLFVKYPTAGEVKTRLASSCSGESAAELYRALVNDIVSRLRGATMDLLICYTPDAARADLQDWLGTDLKYISQKGDGLGERMENAFREAFFMGYRRAVLAGSDVPGLTQDIVQSGLDVLTPQVASVGPASDGGYYLIGFEKYGFAPEVLQGMEWSHTEVCHRTVNRLDALGIECVQLKELDDIDTMADLRQLVERGVDGPLSEATLKMAQEMITKYRTT